MMFYQIHRLTAGGARPPVRTIIVDGAEVGRITPIAAGDRARLDLALDFEIIAGKEQPNCAAAKIAVCNIMRNNGIRQA